jgi:hypothetical protein
LNSRIKDFLIFRGIYQFDSLRLELLQAIFQYQRYNDGDSNTGTKSDGYSQTKIWSPPCNWMQLVQNYCRLKHLLTALILSAEITVNSLVDDEEINASGENISTLCHSLLGHKDCQKERRTKKYNTRSKPNNH